MDGRPALSPNWTPRLHVAAWLVAVIATLGSLRYSGIGVIGWDGLGLPPCELCWYQRILMYPLATILGVAALKRDATAVRLGIWSASAGTIVAAFHSLIQQFPDLEPSQCFVGSCTATLYKVAGLSIPNQSLLAFVLILACLLAPKVLARLDAAQSD